MNINIARFIFIALLLDLSIIFLPVKWLSIVTQPIFGFGVRSGETGILALLFLIALIGISTISVGIWLLFLQPLFKYLYHR